MSENTNNTTTQNNTHQSGNGIGTAAFVFGILAVVLSVGGFIPCLGAGALYLSVPLSIVAGALGFFAHPTGFKKTPGIILGGIGLLLSILAGLYQGSLVNEFERDLDRAEREFRRDLSDLEKEARRNNW